MEVKFRIREYLTNGGTNPFREWLEGLENPCKARVQIRLHRLESGNFGDVKSIGGGIFELRFSFGTGFRIYFGRETKELVILLCGGDKHSQWKDIRKARQLWRSYLEDKNA